MPSIDNEEDWIDIEPNILGIKQLREDRQIERKANKAEKQREARRKERARRKAAMRDDDGPPPLEEIDDDEGAGREPNPNQPHGRNVPVFTNSNEYKDDRDKFNGFPKTSKATKGKDGNFGGFGKGFLTEKKGAGAKQRSAPINKGAADDQPVNTKSNQMDIINAEIEKLRDANTKAKKLKTDNDHLKAKVKALESEKETWQAQADKEKERALLKRDREHEQKVAFVKSKKDNRINKLLDDIEKVTDTSAKSNLLIESLKNDLQRKTNERNVELRKVEKLKDMIQDQHKDKAKIADYEDKFKKAKKKVKEMTKSNRELNEENESQRIQIQTLEADLEYEMAKKIEEADSEVVEKLKVKIKKLQDDNADVLERLGRERNKKAIVMVNDEAQKKLERSYNDKVNHMESQMKDKNKTIKNLTAQNNQSFYNLDRKQHEIERRDEQIANLSAFIDKYISNEENEEADEFEETGKRYFRDCLQKIKTGLTIGPTVTSGECDICYSPLANLPTETWKCKHVFCSVCSRQWRDKNPGGATCPTCRQREPSAREYPKLGR